MIGIYPIDRMKPENAISGFSSTGIWPVNREKCPLRRFDTRILSKYYKSVESGKPPLNWDNVNAPFDNESTNTSSESLPKPSTLGTNVWKSSPLTPPQGVNQKISKGLTPAPTTMGKVLNIQYDDIIMSTLGPFPHELPCGFYWKPNGWKLEPFQESNRSNFEEIFLNKIKPPKEKIPEKRVKVDLKARVISHKNVVKELEEKERKKEDKNRPPKKKSKSEYDEGDINKKEFEGKQLPYEESDEEFCSEEDVITQGKG